MFLGYGIHQVLKALVAIEASRRLSEDRQSGALELLLVTPLPISNILAGQRRALRETFRWPMIFAALVNLFMFLLITGKNPMHMNGNDGVVFCEMFIGGAIMLVLDAFALSWVGMSMALKKRDIIAPFTRPSREMLPPWLAVLLFIFLGIGGTHISSGDMIAAVGLWLFGSAVVDLVPGGRGPGWTGWPASRTFGPAECSDRKAASGCGENGSCSSLIRDHEVSSRRREAEIKRRIVVPRFESFLVHANCPGWSGNIRRAGGGTRAGRVTFSSHCLPNLFSTTQTARKA